MASNHFSEVIDSAPGSGGTLPDLTHPARARTEIRRGWTTTHRRLASVVLLVLTDVAASTAAVITAAWLLGAANLSAGSLSGLWSFAAMILLIQPLIFAVCGAYGVTRGGGIFLRVPLSVVLTSALLWVQTRLGGMGGTGLWTGAGWMTYAVCGSLWILAARRAFDRAVRVVYRLGFGLRRVLVVGSATETASVMKMLRDEAGEDVRIVQRLSPSPRRSGDSVEVADQIGPALQASGATEVVIASSELSFEAFETLVHRCFAIGVSVSVAPRFLDRIHAHINLGLSRGGAVLQLRPKGLVSPDLTSKRVMDVALSVIGLVLLAPLFLVIALAIRLSSPGPIVFRQWRTGIGGRPFQMYKFRTMVENAERIKPTLEHLNQSGDMRLFKIRNDPRVTPVGRFLRATSLDELPQLINVVTGEMSLIGPRPFFPEDLSLYAEHHFIRLSVLPGITGLWQVSGRSDVLDFEEVVRLDQEYIDRWSVWLDLKILGLTVPTVLRRSGAY
jgi:exopolysaccharide biosynthesis polyprenyl glycosylphosphotransferase